MVNESSNVARVMTVWTHKIHWWTSWWMRLC